MYNKNMKKLKTLSDIKNDIRVHEIYKDIEGWWCWLTNEYEHEDDAHLIHEMTIKQICDIINYRVQKLKQ